jgi:hypothetical protein
MSRALAPTVAAPACPKGLRSMTDQHESLAAGQAGQQLVNTPGRRGSSRVAALAACSAAGQHISGVGGTGCHHGWPLRPLRQPVHRFRGQSPRSCEPRISSYHTSTLLRTTPRLHKRRTASQTSGPPPLTDTEPARAMHQFPQPLWAIKVATAKHRVRLDGMEAAT